MRDGTASRRRLLDAAAAEFAEHGFAGARVDRIAAASGVNKQQMYSWHGSKGGLFDAVFDDQLHRIVDAVPFDALDLPGYAVRLYDSYVRQPELVRLASWNRLERVPGGDLLRGHAHLAQPKLEAIAAAQAAGSIVSDLRPGDVYALVIALAGAWSPVSGTVTATARDGEADHARRRDALHRAVRRAFAPAPQIASSDPRPQRP